MFDKMKQLMEMHKKMQEIKRELDSMHFEVSSSDGLITLTMSGSQEVQGATIVGDLQQIEKVRLERTIMEVYSKALKRAQDLAAEKMKEVTGFNLPGLV